MRSKSNPQHKSNTMSSSQEPGPSKRPAPLPLSEEATIEADSLMSETPPTKRRKYYALPRFKVWEKQAIADAFQKIFDGTKWLGNDLPDISVCEEILEKIPHETEMEAEDIQKLLSIFLYRAKKKHQLTGKPIEKWLEVIEALSDEGQDLQKQLSLVMMVAKQEPPDGATPPAAFNPDMPLPNYESIYEYFSCAFTDKPLPELSPIDSLVVEDCMQSLSFQIECLNDDELRRSLRKVYLHMAQSPDEDMEPDQDEMKKNLIHNATALNPLGLNAQAIVPVIPD